MTDTRYRAWLEGAWRLVLDTREIKKGKQKGKIEVQYRSTATLKRKHIIKREDLREINGNDTI